MANYWIDDSQDNLVKIKLAFSNAVSLMNKRTKARSKMLRATPKNSKLIRETIQYTMSDIDEAARELVELVRRLDELNKEDKNNGK